MASVSLENVSKSFAAKRHAVLAVDSLTQEIVDQEYLVLVGPSGCGKSTTLRLIAGLESPDRGTIRIGRRVVNDVAPRDRDVAMVFQDFALYPHMNVFKNLAFGLKVRRVASPEITRRVNEVADLLGLAGLFDRRPTALSGGERQRVALGRAIVRKPKIFLFDEPLSNIDARLRDELRAELRTLVGGLKTTVVHVTHDQEEAITLGDRIAVMDAGAIRQCGRPLDVYNKPADRFVAGFIGKPRMNFIEGRIERDSSRCCFACEVGKLPLSDESSRAVENRVNESVTLGIRAEDVQVITDCDAGAESRRNTGDQEVLECAKIVLVEPLGDCLIVHAKVGENINVVARTAPELNVGPGQSVTLRLRMSRGHLFENGGVCARIN